jgi:hypothetical protein
MMDPGDWGRNGDQPTFSAPCFRRGALAILSGGSWQTDLTSCAAQRFRRRSSPDTRWRARYRRRCARSRASHPSRKTGLCRPGSILRWRAPDTFRSGAVVGQIETPDADIPAGASTALSPKIHELVAIVKTLRARRHPRGRIKFNPPRRDSCTRYSKHCHFSSRLVRYSKRGLVNWAVRPFEIFVPFEIGCARRRE